MFSQAFSKCEAGKDGIHGTDCWKNRLITRIGILKVMKAA